VQSFPSHLKHQYCRRKEVAAGEYALQELCRDVVREFCRRSALTQGQDSGSTASVSMGTVIPPSTAPLPLNCPDGHWCHVVHPEPGPEHSVKHNGKVLGARAVWDAGAGSLALAGRSWASPGEDCPDVVLQGPLHDVVVQHLQAIAGQQPLAASAPPCPCPATATAPRNTPSSPAPPLISQPQHHTSPYIAFKALYQRHAAGGQRGVP